MATRGRPCGLRKSTLMQFDKGNVVVVGRNGELLNGSGDLLRNRDPTCAKTRMEIFSVRHDIGYHEMLVYERLPCDVDAAQNLLVDEGN